MTKTNDRNRKGDSRSGTTPLGNLPAQPAAAHSPKADEESGTPPTRAQIATDVIAVLAKASGHRGDKIREEQRLEKDLNLGALNRENLAPELGAIARKYKSDATTSRTECGKLETVKATIDLVYGKVQ